MNNQFKNIWDNRLKRQDAYQTNAFNYNQLSNGHLYLNTFNNDNYNDHCIDDFRDVLEALKSGLPSHHLLKKSKSFKIIQYTYGNPFQRALIGEDITIYYRYRLDQHTFLISFNEEYIEKDTIVSIYKSRGRIEGFYYVDSGEPVTIKYMTNILIALGLEPHIDDDYLDDIS